MWEKNKREVKNVEKEAEKNFTLLLLSFSCVVAVAGIVAIFPIAYRQWDLKGLRLKVA